MSNTKKISVGDWVRVSIPGLDAIAKFAPPGSRPMNEARVVAIDDDGTIEVAYPIGDDRIEAHSQSGLADPDELTVIDKPDWYIHE